MDETEVNIRRLFEIIKAEARQDVVYLEDIETLEGLVNARLGRDRHCPSCDGHACTD